MKHLISFLFILPILFSKDTQFDKAYKQHQKVCQLNYCKQHLLFPLNCKKYCLSPQCYQKVWSSSPIQIGQQIYYDQQKFKNCYNQKWNQCKKNMDCMFQKLAQYNQKYLYLFDNDD